MHSPVVGVVLSLKPRLRFHYTSWLAPWQFSRMLGTQTVDVDLLHWS